MTDDTPTSTAFPKAENVIDVGWRMGRTNRPKRVVFCIPVYPSDKPFPQTMQALQDEIPFLEKAGWIGEVVCQYGCPYISAARALLLHKAMKKDATVVVFIDQDISWKPGDAVRLIEAEGGVVGGTYRFKNTEERYMGGLNQIEEGVAAMRADGCLEALAVPAGFLKITREAVNKMMSAHPELCCGEEASPHFDMFAHGIMEGEVGNPRSKEWRGEDVALCMRWWQLGEKVWVKPDLDITHHSATEDFPGNLARYLERIAGYSLADLGKFTVEHAAALPEGTIVKLGNVGQEKAATQEEPPPA
jgi:hypothetical protein